MKIDDNDLQHLRSQFELARPILFTGAGFSLGCQNILGYTCPSFGEVKNKLWEMCFPCTPIEEETSVQDLFDFALIRQKKALTDYLNNSFCINSDSIPKWYRTILEMPWYRCYTLNIDNTESAIQRNLSLRREILSVSARSSTWQSDEQYTPSIALDFVHLNGTLDDIPDKVTFSLTQYSQRLSSAEPWYVRLSTELLTHPIIFIGTKLNEPPLWQHIEMRKTKMRGEFELRPRSYLIAPTIDPVRKGLLAYFNINHIPMTAEEFADFLGNLKGSADIGHKSLQLHFNTTASGDIALPEISSFLGSLTKKTEFLMGEQPTWADIHVGRAVSRVADQKIWGETSQIMASPSKNGLIVISGTAGSGKSTSLMRLSMKLHSEGKRVGWVESEADISLRAIKEGMCNSNPPDALMIDDADLYGRDLTPTLFDILNSEKKPLVFLAVRSSKFDKCINPALLSGIVIREITMPLLEDTDIDLLIDALDRDNRLGILKGKDREEQRHAFREQSGRILIVAMIKATSGHNFKDKLTIELTQLEQMPRRIYALLCTASHFRFSLNKEDILIALNESSNEVLNALNKLERQHIISIIDGVNPRYRVLHRLIADILFDELAKTNILYTNILALSSVFASRMTPGMLPSARPRRLLRVIINHDFLLKQLGIERARNLYGELETYLSLINDTHYWLQRGSLEVEADGLDLAENFLSQSLSLDPRNHLAENEYAYFQFKKAIANPFAADAFDLIDDATNTLETSISIRGGKDPYPYHILAAQTLAWCRRAITVPDKKKTCYERLIKLLKEGCSNHPRNAELPPLLDEITREYLTIAVSSTT